MKVRNKLFLLVVLAASLLGGLTIYWWYQEDGGKSILEAEGYVLILGLDDFGEGKRSDTIMVAKLEEEGVKVLSIPRDLRVEFPNGEFHKINAAYAEGGPQLTRKLVSELLGLPIDWHIVVDYPGFIELIDALGGVTITIDKPMRYTDEKQGLYIDLPEGTQTLDGERALDFLRYRDAETGEDLGRIRRQQEFIKALAEKLAKMRGTAQIKTLVEPTLKYVRTNLAALDVYQLVEQLQMLGPEDLELATLPGRVELGEGVSYFIADPVETAAIVAELFHGREVLTNRDVRVIILNGHPDEAIRPGLAKRVYTLLEGQNFQAIAFWNANFDDELGKYTFDYPQSYLINLSGDDDKAERLLNTLKGVPIRVLTPEEFSALTQGLFGEDRLQKIRKMLLTTAVEPHKRAVELNEADLLLILGGDFPKDLGRGE
jgi:LCP family protein required for cell wall assembly